MKIHIEGTHSVSLVKKIRVFVSFYLLSLYFIFLTLSVQGKIVVYPAPQGCQLSSDFKVFADNQQVDVYRIPSASMDGTWRCANYSMAAFDFSGEVTVKVFPARMALILPVYSGISSRIVNDTLIFMLNSPRNISIEPAVQTDTGPLLLFANPTETDTPHRGDPCVLYYGPGLYKETVRVSDNQTLYIAGGAVIQGRIEAAGKNITIRGRGIVDGIPDGGGISIRGSFIRIEGITFKSPDGWAIVPEATDSLSIINVKVCGNRGIRNDDAIDLVNCIRVLIINCFLRVWDDPIAIKGMNHPNLPDSAILIEKCVLWTDGANVFRLGCECSAKAMEDIIIRDIDVIHAHSRTSQEYPLWFISLQPAENMPMRNILFENIRVNWEGQKYLIEVRPQVTVWSKPPEGTIDNVVFRNIGITGTFGNGYGDIKVEGASPEHFVNNVKFENVSRNGACVNANSSSVTVLENTSDIRFSCNKKE
jgi:hypothetical protein